MLKFIYKVINLPFCTRRVKRNHRMATFIKVHCPYCKSEDVQKHGKTGQEKQRYICCAVNCHKTFLLDYTYPGCTQNIQETILNMVLNSSGIRDIGRVLSLSTHTVIKAIKKTASKLIKTNWEKLKNLMDDDLVVVLPVEVELDEQWSFVGSKAHQRWLWVAIDHHTSEILAFVFGKRKDCVLLKLKKLLSRFNVKSYFTDGLGAYQRLLDKNKHTASKRFTQRIERKFLTLRTHIKRLARKTICFSKSEMMHDTIIGLYINRHEFGRNV